MMTDGSGKSASWQTCIWSSIEQPHFSNEYVIWLLKLETYWKYCGKQEKLLWISSVVLINLNNLKIIGWSHYRQLSIFFFSLSIIWSSSFRNAGQRSHNETYKFRVLWKTRWLETWLQNLLCLENLYLNLYTAVGDYMCPGGVCQL